MGEICAVIVGGGSGSRFGGERPKQYLELAGDPVIRWSIRAFLEHPRVDQVVVVLPPADSLAPPFGLAELPVTLAPGGATRSDSVRAGLEATGDRANMVLIHDAARPLVTASIIDRVIDAALTHGAAIAALRVVDTVKAADDAGRVVRTVDREGLWLAQTPQAFDRALLESVHRDAIRDGIHATDDAALLERSGYDVRVVDGAYDNLKITRPGDLRIAEALMEYRMRRAAASTAETE